MSFRCRINVAIAILLLALASAAEARELRVCTEPDNLPFSNRAGATHDDFADFVPLDAMAELGWRIRLEGSQGKPEREFAGPVTGLQEIYRAGLAHLDERAGGNFAVLPGPAQDVILRDQTDTAVQDFVGAALADVLDATYGPPEYGGNRNLVGWTVNHWPGDTQPRGFTPDQVSKPDPQPATPALSAKAAAAALKFLPALAGEAGARHKPWRARPGFERG